MWIEVKQRNRLELTVAENRDLHRFQVSSMSVVDKHRPFDSMLLMNCYSHCSKTNNRDSDISYLDRLFSNANFTSVTSSTYNFARLNQWKAPQKKGKWGRREKRERMFTYLYHNPAAQFFFLTSLSLARVLIEEEEKSTLKMLMKAKKSVWECRRIVCERLWVSQLKKRKLPVKYDFFVIMFFLSLSVCLSTFFPS